MRPLRFFLVFSLLPFLGAAQTDIPTAKPLKIEAANKLDTKGKEQKGTPLKIPSVVGDAPEINLEDPNARKPVKMLPDRKLVQAGTGMKIDPKVGPRNAKEGSSDFFGNMYLGDVKNNGKFVGIVCRDHEYVDGDRVKIVHNDRVIDPNTLLTGSFKGINVDLEVGFNRLDFVALNEGSSSPNTAQVDVYDDQGNLIYSNKWLLSSGSKATLIITKEAEEEE
ncbi:hypothetical protein FK220_004700 [Flavobacteriaceae bacterium TP-CH-4]|uniref:Secreted protein n=1 Tax=Pelagihabitans pacificus TaxID=2696054 RepID=A0A967ASF6_9FLAO|nr:hypothetical protein [Pelagihabitans pacificus]NHF58625.1 hypothetical protein [Pelagihabitans pacificus]